MFFDKQYDTTIIENTTIEELEKKVGKTQRPYTINDQSSKWAYFAYLKGLENGLSEMYSINFGSTISSFIAGMGTDAGTYIYFKTQTDDAIFDIYEDSLKQTDTEEEKVKIFFNKVLEFYKSDNGMAKYEKAIFQHNIRCSTELKNWFKHQSTVSETVIQLMNNEFSETPQFEGGSENINFYLTYSQEEKWENIEGDDDPSKLKKILEE